MIRRYPSPYSLPVNRVVLLQGSSYCLVLLGLSLVAACMIVRLHILTFFPPCRFIPHLFSVVLFILDGASS